MTGTIGDRSLGSGYRLSAPEAMRARVEVDGVAYVRSGRAQAMLGEALGLYKHRAYGILRRESAAGRIRYLVLSPTRYLYLEEDVAAIARDLE